MRLALGMLLASFVVVSLGFSGCGRPAEEVVKKTVGVDDLAGHDHGGWWCSEHGVPEEECALCDTSLVAAFKAKGDWCDEHNRPDSQCFVCNPDNFTKFASRYEAKFGEQPPQPVE